MRRSSADRVLVVAVLIVVALVAYAFLTPGQGPSSTSWSSSSTLTGQVSPMIFTGECWACSYGNPNQNSQSVSPDLAMLYSLGVDSVRMDLNYPVNSNAQSWAQSVKSAGKTLIIADAGSQSFYSSPEPWSQFKADWVTRVTAIAQQFQPTYYIVVKEPGWYVPMVSDATTNPLFQSAQDWTSLTSSLVSAVQSVSPSTKIGIAVSASFGSQTAFYDQYLQNVAQLPGISFIGFDVYTPNALSTTQGYLSQFGSGGKQVWLAETWSSTATNAFTNSPSSDASWLLSIYGSAQGMHVSEINPFFSNIFASYTSPPAAWTVSTPVGLEYQHVISSNRQGASP